MRRSERQSQCHVLTCFRRLGVCRARQLAQLHRDRFLLSVPKDAKYDRRAGSYTRDRPGKFVRVFHLMIIRGRDDIADLDSLLSRRSIRINFRDQSARSFVRPKASAIVGVTDCISTPIQPRVM